MPGLYFHHKIDDENYPDLVGKEMAAEATKVALWIEGALVLAILALTVALIDRLA